METLGIPLINIAYAGLLILAFYGLVNGLMNKRP